MIDLEDGVFMDQVDEMVSQRRWADLRDMLLLLEPADIALILDKLPEDRLPLLYRLLPKETAAEVFVEMEPEVQELLIKTFSDTELKEVLEELYVDDTVDLIEEMPASVVKRILKHTDPETRCPSVPCCWRRRMNGSRTSWRPTSSLPPHWRTRRMWPSS